MNGKIISCNQNANGLVYRVEIFEDEACTELVGEANVIGSESFSRERQYLNKAMIKRYAKSVANRRATNYPWFISDELAQKYGITIELPVGMTLDMKPSPIVSTKPPHQRSLYKNGSTASSNQMSIDEYFLNSSAGFLAEERSVSPPPPQFTFPCDDAIVPVELIDQDLKYPELVGIDQFIKDSDLMTRSLSIWTFCQTFSAQLKLTPFSYDDWEEALTCTDPSIDSNPIIEETFLALLSTLMKDRRNLTKGAFAEKLKSTVLTFKTEICSVNGEDEATAVKDEENEPEIIISSSESDSDEDENEGLFVKRSRKSETKNTQAKKQRQTLLLPSIDLRKHRWYESKAMEYWHFVLGSFFLESIDLISQFIAEEEAKESESEEEEEVSGAEDEEEETANDSAYEDDSSENENDDSSSSKKGKKDSEDETADDNPKPVLKQLNPSAIESPLEIMQNFIKIFEPIAEELTAKGSKYMFTSYLNLSLSSKLALLEFLVHNHYDREAFKAFVEDCLERQGESRRVRKEVEQEAREAALEVERLENEVSRLKEENLKITERLEADESDIEMSSSDNDSEKESENTETTKVSAELPPLTETEREELIEKRAGNKKEISGLNATLRKLRPEATSLQRKSDAANRDLRKCSSYRTFSLGIDRLGREYWWFGDFINPLGRLLVLDSQKQTWLGAIDTEVAFNQFMDWLNPLGIREAKLKAALLEIESDIKVFLLERDLPESLKKETEVKEQEQQQTDVAVSDDEEEIDFEAFRRGRGRPPKGSSSSTNVPAKRPFQKYKNTM